MGPGFLIPVEKKSDLIDKTKISGISKIFVFIFLFFIYFLVNKIFKINFGWLKKLDPTDKTKISDVSRNFVPYCEP